MNLTARNSGARTGDSPAGFRARWYVVFIVFLVEMAGLLDRQILTMLVAPMKRDLHLTDQQIGVLTGTSFALAYAIFALPAGFLSDRLSRKKLLGAGLLIWSLATAASGLATSIFALAAARFAVGVGESTIVPTALPMIAASFPPERRALPLAVGLTGAAMGVSLAMVLGGAIVSITDTMPPIDLPIVGPIFAWQSALLIAGLVGIVIFGLLLFMKEPTAGPAVRMPAGEAYAYFLRHKSVFAIFFLGFPLFGVASFGMVNWMPAYLMRVFDIPGAVAGGVMGTVALPAALGGPLLAGLVGTASSRSAVPGSDMRIAALLMLVAAGLYLGAVAAPALWPAAMMFGAGLLLANGATCISMIALQNVTLTPYRGQASSFVNLSFNCLGAGMGPLLVGALSTHFLGETHLGVAMAIVAAVAAPSAALIILVFLPAYKAMLLQARAGEGAATGATAL